MATQPIDDKDYPIDGKASSIEELSDINYKKGKIKDLRHLKRTNERILTVMFGTLMIAGSFYLLRPEIFERSPSVGPTVFVGFVLATAIMIIVGYTRQRQIDDEIKELEGEIDASTVGAKGKSTEETYFVELVSMNISNLRAYYDLVKSHTNKSFMASVAAGITGFLLILWGVYGGLSDPTKIDAAKLSAYTGIIIEFISGVFFYLYNRTVLQLKAYHDSLLDVQNVLLSFRCVEGAGINDEAQRIEIIKQMLAYLLTKKEAKTE